jgi:hypothetical protein
MRYDYGFRKVLDEPGFVNRIVLNLASDVVRTRTIIMQMMALIAANPSGGADVVLDAFHFYSARMQERTRFETVAKAILADRSDDAFVLANLSCFVHLLKNTANRNKRVYLQTDLERAGIPMVLAQLKGHHHRQVAALLEEYDSLVLDVTQVIKSRDETQELYDTTASQLKTVQDTLRTISAERDTLRNDYKRVEVRATDLDTKLQTRVQQAEQLEGKIKRLQAVMVEQEELMTEQQQQLKQVEDEAIRTVRRLVATRSRTGGLVFPYPRTIVLRVFSIDCAG